MPAQPERKFRRRRSELAVGHKSIKSLPAIAFVAHRNIKNLNQTKKKKIPTIS